MSNLEDVVKILPGIGRMVEREMAPAARGEVGFILVVVDHAQATFVSNVHVDDVRTTLRDMAKGLEKAGAAIGMGVVPRNGSSH